MGPMRHRRRRRGTPLAQAVLLVSLVGSLAACGSSGSPGPAASSGPAATGTGGIASAAAASFVQFYFQDGSFTDGGVPEPSTPAYYRVPAGREFQFSIDYSKLAKDPNADKSRAGYLSAPGRPVAVWS